MTMQELPLPTYETVLTEAIKNLTVDSGVVSAPVNAGGNSLSDATKAWAANVHKNRLIKIVRGEGVGQLAVIDGNSSNSLVIKGNWSQKIGAGAVYVILDKDLAQILRDVFGGGFDISVVNPLPVDTSPGLEATQNMLRAVFGGVPSIEFETGITSSFGDWNLIRASAIQGDYAYIAYIDGIYVVDISDKRNPKIIANLVLLTGQQALDIEVDGNYLYVSVAVDNSLYIVDISDPTSPSIAGFVKDDVQLGGIHGIAKSGDYAYACCYTGHRLTIIDVSNPASPTIVSSLHEVDNLRGVHDCEVVADYVYCGTHFSAVSGEGRFTVVDVSNPLAPVVLSSIRSRRFDVAADVVISGDTAYCGMRSGNGTGINVIDITNPAAPAITTTLGHSSMYVGVMYGTLLYAIDHDRTIYVIRTPANILLKKLYIPRHFLGLWHVNLTDDGKYLLVCSSAGGVGKCYLIDASADPDFYAQVSGAGVMKGNRPIIEVSVLAAGATTSLDDCDAVNLSNRQATLAITAECTYDAAATTGLRVHIRSSYDSVNWDTIDLYVFDNEFAANTTKRKTVELDAKVRFIKVLAENLDAVAGHDISDLKVTATLGG